MNEATGVALADMMLPTYRQMLGALSNWLNQAQTQLGQPDVDALMGERLAPDMFPLSTQVRFCCVQVMEGVSRLTGKPFPAAVDTLLEEGRNAGEAPGTLANARARIAESLAWLDTQDGDAMTLEPDDAIEHSLPNGIVFDFTAEGYVRDWALPQFNFHLMTAYAIMRSRGVELGKVDYVSHLLPMVRPGTMPG